MATRDSKSFDYSSVKSGHRKGSAASGDLSPVSPRKNKPEKNSSEPLQTFASARCPSPAENVRAEESEPTEQNFVELPSKKEPASLTGKIEEIPYAERHKVVKQKKEELKNKELLSSDSWVTRNGHTFTFVGIFLFTFFVFFRPYELIPGAGFLSSGALIIAVSTLAIFLPTQFSTEGSVTVLTTEVKCILALIFIALLTMPIARSPAQAWDTFNEPFIKAVLMFIVMVNVLRTRKRLMGILWLSFGISFYMSLMAVISAVKGEYKTEGYRVSLELQGLFANPNDMSLHLTTMTPIVVALGIAAKSHLMRLVYFALAVLFLAANMVTFSRGGFLGLLASMAVLVWKIGRKNRVRVSIASVVAGLLFILLAPGNYGMRIMSIFFSSLDPVGSADMRKESLMQSVIVTLRNPWGIGIGNFPIVGHHNLQTHNAYTQVSAELGLLGLAAYLIFMVSPLRKLGAVERQLFARDDFSWEYYLSIGLQGSIISFMVSSFFGAVAYNWFVYYLIAYAVCLRRIYQTGQAEQGIEVEEGGLRDYFKLQRA